MRMHLQHDDVAEHSRWCHLLLHVSLHAWLSMPVNVGLLCMP